MDIPSMAQRMLEKRSLCDHCLGRQFAMLGHGMGNDERGKAIRTTLILNAHSQMLSGNNKGTRTLRLLATNGFSGTAREILEKAKKHIEIERDPEKCFLCENRFADIEDLAGKALKLLDAYEHCTFLVGIELPVTAAEREDEFKAEFDISHGENMRNEFGRLIGKVIAERSGKEVEFRKPEIVVRVNPFGGKVWLQVNPLFVSGRYKKLARGIPQSRWFCSHCRGKGCKECNWTGKMYPESVQEIIEKPFLGVTGGVKGSFHASGREDIDARMLGNGRPFVVEITKPRKRFLNLKEMEKAVNIFGKDKIQVSNLKLGNKDTVRKLKKGESKQKEYSVIIEFENRITIKDMHALEEHLSNALVNQKTPTRVMHRRADLTREKYIYDVKVKKLSPRRAEMKIRCSGGLYVKELVSGDEGRTTPNVSELLKNKAKPMKLDVLNVIMGDPEEVEN